MRYITTQEIKDQVLDYEKTPQEIKVKIPSILKFTGDWCTPCKMINPILEELEKEYEGKFEVLNVDVDKEPEAAQAFGVRSIPNMVFIPTEGTPERMVGALPKQAIEEAIQGVFNLN